MWATQVQHVLESKGLWNYVQRNGIVLQGMGEKKKTLELLQCRVEVILNIETKFVASVMTNRDLKIVLEKLKKMHESKCAASQLTLSRRVLNLRMKPEGSIRFYVKTIFEIENERAMTDLELGDDDKELASLEGLNKEYYLLLSIHSI